MLQERTAAWEKALEDWDIIPQFIQDIHKYATKLQVRDGLTSACKMSTGSRARADS